MEELVIALHMHTRYLTVQAFTKIWQKLDWTQVWTPCW
jgi:hypothetical protein